MVRFAPVEDAKETLTKLVQLYLRSREEPLPLIERVTRELAGGVGKNEQSAFNKAASTYKSQQEWDPRLAFVFGPESPFEDPEWRETFKSVALELYEPLLKHRSDG